MPPKIINMPRKSTKPPPVIMQIAFPDQKQMDKFVKLVSDYAKEDSPNYGFVKAALSNELAETPFNLRYCRVLVGNTKIAEGTLDKMKTRFEQEVGSHSGSVYLQELKGGKWESIQTRGRAG